MTTVDEIIKREMTPRTVEHWGDKFHDFVPELISSIHGDGKAVLYITPLATRPYYYILRVDSSLKKMEKKDPDKFSELMDNEFLSTIEEECGSRHETDDDGNEELMPWPALDDSCGWDWEFE
ncbi:MAG: hypothetical protein WBN66_03645 [Smithella sp.]